MADIQIKNSNKLESIEEKDYNKVLSVELREIVSWKKQSFSM